MSQVRIVSFDGLLERLREALGNDSLLYERFDYALRNKDENAIDAAMQSLKIYPQSTREAVEEAMLSWLFDSQDTGKIANVNVPSNDPSNPMNRENPEPLH